MCGSWTFSSHPAPRNRLDQGRCRDSGRTEQPSFRSSINTDKPGPAAEQRQVWGTRPSLGPWHPPLRSTHRVGSVGQVRTGKINGAGAGWGGQSPGRTRSPLETECPTQAKNQSGCHSARLGLAWRWAGASPAAPAAHPVPPVPCLSWPHLVCNVGAHREAPRAQPVASALQ